MLKVDAMWHAVDDGYFNLANALRIAWVCRLFQETHRNDQKAPKICNTLCSTYPFALEMCEPHSPSFSHLTQRRRSENNEKHIVFLICFRSISIPLKLIDIIVCLQFANLPDTCPLIHLRKTQWGQST